MAIIYRKIKDLTPQQVEDGIRIVAQRHYESRTKEATKQDWYNAVRSMPSIYPSVADIRRQAEEIYHARIQNEDAQQLQESDWDRAEKAVRIHAPDYVPFFYDATKSTANYTQAVSINSLTLAERHWVTEQTARQIYQKRQDTLARGDWGLAVNKLREENPGGGWPKNEAIKPLAEANYGRRMANLFNHASERAVKNLKTQGIDNPDQQQIHTEAQNIMEQRRQSDQDLDWKDAEQAISWISGEVLVPAYDGT